MPNLIKVKEWSYTELVKQRQIYFFLKRAFDFLFSLSGLLVSSILMVIIAILIKLDSPGPVFYRQWRVGKNGKLFKLYKFRTMVKDADRIGGTVTTADDPRTTRIGKILRKFKLDELPQLWNVLKGDMSFVGPRPDVPGFADKLKGKDRIILSVRPGITGPATLKFRDEEELLKQQENPEEYNLKVIWPEKVRINREYVENYSFWKDIKYILLTIKAIFKS